MHELPDLDGCSEIDSECDIEIGKARNHRFSPPSVRTSPSLGRKLERYLRVLPTWDLSCLNRFLKNNGSF